MYMICPKCDLKLVWIDNTKTEDELVSIFKCEHGACNIKSVQIKYDIKDDSPVT